MSMSVDERFELEKQKRIERANAYRDMMKMWAWKDLMKSIEEIKNDAERDLHLCPLDKLMLSPYLVARLQGVLTGFDKMESEISLAINDGTDSNRPNQIPLGQL